VLSDQPRLGSALDLLDNFSGKIASPAITKLALKLTLPANSLGRPEEMISLVRATRHFKAVALVTGHDVGLVLTATRETTECTLLQRKFG